MKELIESFSKTNNLSRGQIAALMNTPDLRKESVSYLRTSPNRFFALYLLKAIMDLREAKDELGYFENLMLACYLVGIHQQVEDCLLIEQAKDMDFDTYCGVDTALIFFAGFQNTVKYLETVDTPKAKEWVSQLHNWPKESIEEVDEYYATKPWWI